MRYAFKKNIVLFAEVRECLGSKGHCFKLFSKPVMVNPKCLPGADQLLTEEILVSINCLVYEMSENSEKICITIFLNPNRPLQITEFVFF